MNKDDVFYKEQINAMFTVFLMLVTLTKEANAFLGDMLQLLLIIGLAVFGLYTAVKLTYMVLIPVRGTWLRKIVPLRIREVFK